MGRTSEEELAAIIGEGGQRGVIYRKLRDLRDRYATLVRERYPRIPRRVSGYNLDQLLPENGFHVARALVGSESACVIVLGATARLIHSPKYRALVVIGYPDLFTAGDNAATQYASTDRSASKRFRNTYLKICAARAKPSLGPDCCPKAIRG